MPVFLKNYFAGALEKIIISTPMAMGFFSLIW
jgi:hypothetical protein